MQSRLSHLKAWRHFVYLNYKMFQKYGSGEKNGYEGLKSG